MTQQIEVSGRMLTIEVYPAYIGWDAVEDNYDGPEDHYRAAWGKTREEAIEALTEKMTDYIEKYPDYLID